MPPPGRGGCRQRRYNLLLPICRKWTVDEEWNLAPGSGHETWQREREIMRKSHAVEKTTRRRSSRILLRLPVLVGRPDASSPTEWENVETIILSRHGGLLRARQNFGVGTAIEIRMLNKDRTARARVVWKSSRPTPQGLELGFEIIDQPGFWEIRFPPDASCFSG